MIERYKTIFHEAQAETIEKKSRFIATVRPVNCEKEAQFFVEEMKKKYWDANHNVFAYQIGERNEIQRCSDDGEPSGTAGMPVLDVLKGEDIKNAAVVVTRYFGGILLGTGGLVRAYGRSAKEGILAGQIIEKILYQIYTVVVEYPLMGKVQYEIMQNGHNIHKTEYTDQVIFTVLVEYPIREQFQQHMTEITSGQGEINEENTVYGALIDEKLEII